MLWPRHQVMWFHTHTHLNTRTHTHIYWNVKLRPWFPFPHITYTHVQRNGKKAVVFMAHHSSRFFRVCYFDGVTARIPCTQLTHAGLHIVYALRINTAYCFAGECIVKRALPIPSPNNKCIAIHKSERRKDRESELHCLILAAVAEFIGISVCNIPNGIVSFSTKIILHFAHSAYFADLTHKRK